MAKRLQHSTRVKCFGLFAFWLTNSTSQSVRKTLSGERIDCDQRIIAAYRNISQYYHVASNQTRDMAASHMEQVFTKKHNRMYVNKKES